jgi:hypothetical protein
VSAQQMNRFVESLEGRQFLSMTPYFPASVRNMQGDAPALHVDRAAAKAKPKDTPTTTFSLLGTWHGNWKVQTIFGRLSYKVTFTVTNVDTAANRLTGTIDIKNHDDYAGEFAGSLGAKGKFTYTIWNGDKVQISAAINKANTSFNGSMTIWYDHGAKVKGDISLVKDA